MSKIIALNERIPYRPYRNCFTNELAEGGYAAISADENFLTLRAVMHDSDMYSDSTGEDQPMWLLGDVLEFFIWIPPREDYFEFQVSVNGDKLQIHLSDFYVVYDRTLEDILEKNGMTAKVRKFKSKNLWYGMIRIPLENLGIKYSGLDGARVFSGRYNYNHNWDEPELSATCRFEGKSFHSPNEWDILSVK